MSSNYKKTISEWKDDVKKNIKESINTIIASCRTVSKEEFETDFGISDWEEKANKLQLDITDQNSFVICPVFFSNIADDINICALCFALLILFKGVKFLSNEAEIGTLKAETDKTITRLLNTIVLTAISISDRNGNQFTYWPTTITRMKITETGTCNQTTVALSTLLRVGFLKKSPRVSEDAIKERYALVVNALSWLTSIQTGDYNTVWAYGEDCFSSDRDTPITYSVLSSHFCYETLKKYVLFFNSSDGSNEIVSRINPQVLDSIHSACCKFEKWVEPKLEGSGGVSKNNISNSPSVLHTCLCQIIYLYDATDLNAERLNNAVNYVLKNLNDFSFDDHDLLESYRYRYRTSDNRTGLKNDTYEIIPEFVFVNYSTRLINSYYSRFLSKTQINKLKEATYIAYEKLLSKKDIITYNGAKDCLILNGIQTGDKRQPIYGLYDLQFCLIELFESSAGKDEITIMRKPINRPLIFSFAISIILFVIGVIIILISLNVDDKNTITGILTGLAIAFFNPIVRLIKKNK